MKWLIVAVASLIALVLAGDGGGVIPTLVGVALVASTILARWKTPDPRIFTPAPAPEQERPANRFLADEWVYLIPWDADLAAFPREMAYIGQTTRTPLERWKDEGHWAQDPRLDPARAMWIGCGVGESVARQDAEIVRYWEAGHRLLNVKGVPR